VDSEIGLIKLAGSVGGGFEYNLSESTSLTVAVNFDYGFTSLTKKTSKHVIAFDQNPTTTTFSSYSDQKNTPHAVRLTVGILF